MGVISLTSRTCKIRMLQAPRLMRYNMSYHYSNIIHECVSCQRNGQSQVVYNVSGHPSRLGCPWSCWNHINTLDQLHATSLLLGRVGGGGCLSWLGPLAWGLLRLRSSPRPRLCDLQKEVQIQVSRVWSVNCDNLCSCRILVVNSEMLAS